MSLAMFRGAALAVGLMVLSALASCSSSDSDPAFKAVGEFREEKDRADAALEVARKRCRELQSSARADCMTEAEGEHKRHMASAQVRLEVQDR